MMTRDQIIELLQLIRIHDNRHVDEPTIAVFTAAAQRASWTLPEAREAILDHYTNTTGEWLMPGHITTHIKHTQQETLRNLPPHRRSRMEAAYHALQDMGYPPPVAHQFTRATELGQPTNITLTEHEWTELRTRITQHQTSIEPGPYKNPLQRILHKLANQKTIPQ